MQQKPNRPDGENLNRHMTPTTRTPERSKEILFESSRNISTGQPRLKANKNREGSTDKQVRRQERPGFASRKLPHGALCAYEIACNQTEDRRMKGKDNAFNGRTAHMPQHDANHRYALGNIDLCQPCPHAAPVHLYHTQPPESQPRYIVTTEESVRY